MTGPASYSDISFQPRTGNTRREEATAVTLAGERSLLRLSRSARSQRGRRSAGQPETTRISSTSIRRIVSPKTGNQYPVFKDERDVFRKLQSGLS